jgi:ubiquinone/menaquinone biosynthesis C-methylase UbiE
MAIAKQNTEDNNKIKVCLLDAMNLPFTDNSFDVIIIFEAIYYLPDVKLFLKRVNRILNKGGHLLISTVNCNWHGFNRSPGAVNYLDLRGLHELLKSQNYVSTFKIGFYDEPKGINVLVSQVRKMAVKLKLIPGTMKGKAIFKRFFYGRLRPIPKFITRDAARLYPLVNFNSSIEITNYKQLYIVAKNIKLD